MVSAFLNTVKIPELRRRILFTLAVVVVVRLGAAITTPGVNQAVLQEWFRSALTEKSGGNLAALLNLFSGGALENCAIFSLGIMPYISASIMMQLLSAVIPQLGRLAREDGGRQKIMQYTRFMTLGLCIFQGYLLAISFQHPEAYRVALPGISETIAKLGIPLVDDPGWVFRVVTVISLTTGTLLLMWLGDQITERGIGNGISLIITIGIVARLPAALAQAWKTFVPSSQTGTSQVNPAILVLMVAFLFIVIASVIAITQAVRKITVQYAKRVVGRKQYGGYIPGVRPGKPTADFLDYTMTRLTFAGAIFLTMIAVLPSLLSQGLHVPTVTAQFFGGTSLLIIVGVMLDTMRQVETHLIQRHYDGFLRKGKIRGRSFDRAAYARGEAVGSGTLIWFGVGIAVLVIAGVAIFLYGR